MTLKRHIVVALRSIDICKCGCRGYCTLFPILSCIRWQLEALAAGVRPTARHDLTAWTAEEAVRFRAGVALDMVALLLWIKGDWAEHTSTLGFAAWGSHFFPCLWCGCMLDGLFDFLGLSLAGDPWGPAPNYDQACRACEIRVVLTTEADRLLLFTHGGLGFRRGRGGYALSADVRVGVAHLLAGDKLMPTRRLQDVAKMRAAPLPLELVFWRTHTRGGMLADPVHFRNPILCDELGTGSTDIMMIDVLHAVVGGPVMHLSLIHI